MENGWEAEKWAEDIHRERDRPPIQAGMCVLDCSGCASSLSVLASVFCCSINHSPKTSRLNGRGCCTASLPFCKGYFLYRLTLQSPYSSIAYQLLATCLLYGLFSLPPSFLKLENRSGANYINNWKVWKIVQKWSNCFNLILCSPLIDVRSGSLHV